jgi:hypothetical protein
MECAKKTGQHNQPTAPAYESTIKSTPNPNHTTKQKQKDEEKKRETGNFHSHSNK